MSINKRIGILLHETKTKPKDFAKLLGVSKQHISGLVTGNAPIGMQIIRHCLRQWPDVNLNWLILGEGEMFRKQEGNILEEPAAKYGRKDRLEEAVNKSLDIIEKELALKNKQIRLQQKELDKKK